MKAARQGHDRSRRLRTVLICHRDEPLNLQGMAGWLASFSDLAGVVIIEEPPGRKWLRVRREVRRSGLLRFVDILAFRAFRLVALAAEERRWREAELRRLTSLYPLDTPPQQVVVASPNNAEAEAFIRAAQPDVMIARCKHLLAERVFTIPRSATLVMHPGVCPEYRNAHGCFWAMVREDYDRVGMTLLQVDRGVDTGPVYAHLSCSFNPATDSPFIVQERVVWENLPELASLLDRVAEGQALPLDTHGRESRAWGQPWLSSYLRWRWRVPKAAPR